MTVHGWMTHIMHEGVKVRDGLGRGKSRKGQVWPARRLKIFYVAFWLLLSLFLTFWYLYESSLICRSVRKIIRKNEVRKDPHRGPALKIRYETWRCPFSQATLFRTPKKLRAWELDQLRRCRSSFCVCYPCEIASTGILTFAWETWWGFSGGTATQVSTTTCPLCSKAKVCAVACGKEVQTWYEYTGMYLKKDKNEGCGLCRSRSRSRQIQYRRGKPSIGCIVL